MRFLLEGLEVFFPYEYIYPEQLDYMRELKVGEGQRSLASSIPRPTQPFPVAARARRGAGTVPPRDAHGNGEDGDVAGPDHVVPARQQVGRQAHLLHAHGARDEQGSAGGGAQRPTRHRLRRVTPVTAPRAQCVAELKTVIEYRNKAVGKTDILAVCLSSRRNLSVPSAVGQAQRADAPARAPAASTSAFSTTTASASTSSAAA